ncbi:hypothetical protein A3Q56_03117 [Intoshia linei]|uniref:Uncharacterized protein n=1 Tax=Intoshia linei TaxID=1819745 RepID=A0A177B606_9BILA|nr:hypothetical protein A3Q56_03117 [Intoshia linei]
MPNLLEDINILNSQVINLLTFFLKMNRIPESFDSKIYFETYRFESFFPDEVSPRLIIFQQSEDEEIFKRKRVDTNSMNSIIQEAIQQKSLIISDENEKLLKEADDVDSDTEKGVHINDNASYTSSTSNVSEQQKKETKESVYTFERSSVVLTRILGTKERVSAIFRVSRINRLQKSDALLVFGIGRLYIIDGYTDFGDGSIVDINSIDPKSQEPIVPLAPSTENTSQIRENIIVKYKDILDCKKRRYILQRIGLEIFISNGKVIFLVCCRKERNLVYNKICLKIKNRKNHYLRGIIKNEANLTDVTTQWENGEISNFDYLMYINIESGRTYNDLMQYPIFPWILSDYKSDTLNLNDPKSFRDLSKPMGAQDEIRLKKFKESREVLKEHYPEKSAYLYGTHYLSAAVVCNFLIRMEPFSICSITIQGNEFDTSDRLFKNISEAYSLASKLITHDVRELIPEFFYLPDYLINMNKFMFGQTQNGNLVDNVVLPKWAKEDPREFIRMHREALECDYVSANIHRWIDLIFGYCQRGKMAEEKDNVFHSLFYEGTVDIFSPEYKSDNLMLHSIIDFINNFGQIPSQLFVKPHVCKKLNMQRILVSTRMTNSLFSVDSDMPIKRIPIFYNYIHALHPSNDFIKKIKSPVGSIVTVKSQKTIYISVIGKNSLLLPPDYKYYIMWNQVDHSLKFLVLETDKVVFCAEHYNLINVTIAAATKKNTIILGTKSGLLHIAVILNIATPKMSIWFIKKLTLHTSKITCISISSDQNVFLTCDNDGKSIIWNLSKYTYVKKIQVCNQPISCCYINHTNGYIITATKTKIYVWDINGCFIVDTTLDSPHTYINCIKMSQMYNWNNKNVIMAGCSDGIVRMWSIRHRKRLSLPSKIVSRGNSVNSEETQFCQAFPSNTDILISYEDYEEKSSVVTWECYLKLRGTLTKFTSYKRPDNHQPASITTISITLDHKMILIGDSLGRVFCWEVPSSSPSTTTDVWVDDDFCDSCSDCLIKFTDGDYFYLLDGNLKQGDTIAVLAATFIVPIVHHMLQ